MWEAFQCQPWWETVELLGKKTPNFDANDPILREVTVRYFGARLNRENNSVVSSLPL
jgi:hypothetical protein